MKFWQKNYHSLFCFSGKVTQKTNSRRPETTEIAIIPHFAAIPLYPSAYLALHLSILKMGQTWPLFVYFDSFHMTNTTQIL